MPQRGLSEVGRLGPMLAKGSRPDGWELIIYPSSESTSHKLFLFFSL